MRKILSIGDFIVGLQRLVDTGARRADEPFRYNGTSGWEEMRDARTGEIVARGTIEVDDDTPEMFRPPWE